MSDNGRRVVRAPGQRTAQAGRLTLHGSKPARELARLEGRLRGALHPRKPGQPPGRT